MPYLDLVEATVVVVMVVVPPSLLWAPWQALWWGITMWCKENFLIRLVKRPILIKQNTSKKICTNWTPLKLLRLPLFKYLILTFSSAFSRTAGWWAPSPSQTRPARSSAASQWRPSPPSVTMVSGYNKSNSLQTSFFSKSKDLDELDNLDKISNSWVRISS